MFKKSFNLLVAIILIFFAFSYGQEGKKVIPLTTKSEEAMKYYKKALLAINQVYEKETVENFKKAIEADPEFVMARAYYSIYLNNPENRQMIAETKKYFDKVTEGEKLFTLAMEAVINNNSAKEREILEELAIKYPDDATVYSRLAGNYYFARMFQKTIEESKKLLECEESSYIAYNFLGYAYLQIGKFDEAIKWIKKYAELRPKDANPLDSLGDAHRHAGKYKEAWEYYKKAVEMNPNLTFPHSHLGDVKHELGYYEEAIPYYQDALKTLLPEREISESHTRAADAFWRVRLANNYLQMGEIDKAEKEVNTILQSNSTFGNVYGHYLAAEIALKKGDIQKAKEEANLAKKLEKENNFLNREKDQIVNFVRAKIALAEKDLTSAEKFVLAAVNAFPEEGRSFMLSFIYPLGNDRRICVEPLNLLAKIRRKQNRVDDEIQAIKKSLELIPHQPKLYYRLGEIYAQQNKEWEAERAYVEFLSLCEDFKCCEEAKKKAEKFITDNVGYKLLSSEELIEKIDNKDKIILIDCRPDNEYKDGHIPRAVNFSMKFCAFEKDTAIKAEMEKFIEEIGKNIHFILIDVATYETYMPKTKIMELIKYLPEERDKEVIFYCRKPI